MRHPVKRASCSVPAMNAGGLWGILQIIILSYFYMFLDIISCFWVLLLAYWMRKIRTHASMVKHKMFYYCISLLMGVFQTSTNLRLYQDIRPKKSVSSFFLYIFTAIAHFTVGSTWGLRIHRWTNVQPIILLVQLEH